MVNQEFRSLFAQKSKKPSQALKVEHRIDTGSAHPTNNPPYRAGRKEREEIEIQVLDMLANNIIEPSNSPWASIWSTILRRL